MLQPGGHLRDRVQFPTLKQNFDKREIMVVDFLRESHNLRQRGNT